MTARWTVEAGRQICFDDRPFVSLNREGAARPVEADAMGHFLADCLNRQAMTPEELYRRQMGGRQRPLQEARNPAAVYGRKSTRTRESRKRGFKYEVDEASRISSYGTVPSFEQFTRDIREIDPDENKPYWPEGYIYPMELVESEEIDLAQQFGELTDFDTARPGYAYGFRGNERTLYDFLSFLAEQWNSGNEAAGNLASSIMYTLGYEWF